MKDSGAVELIPVCMESEIGLGVPRDPVRIVQDKEGRKRLMQPATGAEVTDLAIGFTDAFMSSVKDLDGFLLKSRSPSGGIRDTKVYPSTEKAAALTRGSGIFGEAALRRFPLVAIEDGNRLWNIKLAEHFPRIFAFASWRTWRGRGAWRTWWSGNADNKLLLMMYSQKDLRSLGNLVADRGGLSVGELKASYGEGLHRALASPPRCASPVNVLQHCLGYVSDRLTKEERGLLPGSAGDVSGRPDPLSVCLGIMRSWGSSSSRSPICSGRPSSRPSRKACSRWE